MRNHVVKHFSERAFRKTFYNNNNNSMILLKKIQNKCRYFSVSNFLRKSYERILFQTWELKLYLLFNLEKILPTKKIKICIIKNINHLRKHVEKCEVVSFMHIQHISIVQSPQSGWSIHLSHHFQKMFLHKWINLLTRRFYNLPKLNH